jgi:hypothetical protein
VSDALVTVGSAVLALVAGLVGVYALRLAGGALWQTFRLASATDAPAREGEYVRLRGRVRPVTDTVTAPLSGEECVGYVVAQEQYLRAGGTPFRRWRGHVVARECPAFAVDDTGTRLRVRPTSFTHDDAELVAFGSGELPGSVYSDWRLRRDEQSRRYDASERVPESVVELLGLGGVSVDADHRYVEWRIERGDDLLVVGRREARDPTVAETAGAFVLSEVGLLRSVCSPLRRGVLFGAFGLGALAAAGVLSWAVLV